jgi:acyl dehydratase
MIDSDLEGTQLQSGEYEVASWKAHLWADATRNHNDAFRYEEDARETGEPGQLVPHSMCQHIVFEATGGIDETMSYITEDWTNNAALGGLRADFHAPILVGQTLQVEGEITSVVEKDGSSGSMTIVTFDYAVTTPDGEHVYDLEADLVLMGGD